jgi:hypothetical protein
MVKKFGQSRIQFVDEIEGFIFCFYVRIAGSINTDCDSDAEQARSPKNWGEGDPALAQGGQRRPRPEPSE